MSVKEIENGAIFMVQKTIDGRIAQLAMSKEQSDLLYAFITELTKEKPFIRMPKQYDLKLINI